MKKHIIVTKKIWDKKNFNKINKKYKIFNNINLNKFKKINLNLFFLFIGQILLKKIFMKISNAYSFTVLTYQNSEGALLYKIKF